MSLYLFLTGSGNDEIFLKSFGSYVPTFLTEIIEFRDCNKRKMKMNPEQVGNILPTFEGFCAIFEPITTSCFGLKYLHISTSPWIHEDVRKLLNEYKPYFKEIYKKILIFIVEIPIPFDPTLFTVLSVAINAFMFKKLPGLHPKTFDDVWKADLEKEIKELEDKIAKEKKESKSRKKKEPKTLKGPNNDEVSPEGVPCTGLCKYPELVHELLPELDRPKRRERKPKTKLSQSEQRIKREETMSNLPPKNGRLIIKKKKPGKENILKKYLKFFFVFIWQCTISIVMFIFNKAKGKFRARKSSIKKENVLTPIEEVLVQEQGVEKEVNEKEDIDPKLFALYIKQGLKDNIKRLIDNFEININEEQENGNTFMHLAITGDHLPIVQTLLSKFSKNLNLSMRNNEGFNPLDLAIRKKNKAIINLLLKHGKPEISSLKEAVNSNQLELVLALSEKLIKVLGKNTLLSSCLNRFVSLNKQLDQKNLSADHKAIVMADMKKYKKAISASLESYKNGDKSELDKRNEGCVEKALREFECPVCCFLMTPPRRIFSCSHDHWICSLCLADPKVKSCPICREDFVKREPCVRHTSERVLSMLLPENLDEI